MMNNRKNMALSSFWAMLRFGTVMAKAILFVPLMLSFWNKELYAFWVLLLAANAFYFSIFDGYIRYVGNEYNLYFHKDPQQAAHILGSGIKLLLYKAAGLLLLIGLFTALWPSFAATILNTTTGVIQVYHLGFALFIMTAGNTCLNLTRFLFALNEPVGRIWENIRFEVLATAAEVVLLCAALALHCSFLVAVAVSSTCYIIGSLWYVLVLRRRYIFLLSMIFTGSLRQGFASFKRSVLLIINNLTEKLSTDAYSFLLGLFSFPLLLIRQFASVRTMTNASVSGFNILQGIMVPRVQEYEARGNTSGLLLVLKGLWLMMAVLLCPVVILAYPLLQQAYLLWTRGHIEFSPVVFGLLMIWMIIYLYGNVMMIYLKSVNRTRQLLGITIFKTLLLLSWLLACKPAAENMVWAFLSGDIIAGLIVYPVLVAGKKGNVSELLICFLPMIFAVVAVCDYMLYGFSLLHAVLFFAAFCVAAAIVYRHLWRMLPAFFSARKENTG